jgi:hypothetical protein
MSIRRMDPVSAPPREDVASPTGRIALLDQFRGYTVAGMLLVNFLGGFAVVPVNLWTMSQRTGSIVYLTFASGLSLLVYATDVPPGGPVPQDTPVMSC